MTVKTQSRTCRVIDPRTLIPQNPKKFCLSSACEKFLSTEFRQIESVSVLCTIKNNSWFSYFCAST